MNKKIIYCLALSILLFANITFVHSVPVVEIGLNTSKQVYNVGEAVYISGNVTADGALVNDTLVAIEIIDPYNNPYVVRTVDTGENHSRYWKVKIISLFSCDSQGNPKSLFNKGSMAYVSLTLKNNHTLIYHVKAALYVQYSDNSPLIAFYPYEKDVDPGQEDQIIASLPIPSTAISGQATIFASLFSDTPFNGGTPYCAEVTANFYIATTTPLAQPQPEYFNILFKLPKTNVKIGSYVIYARVQYLTAFATKIKAFTVTLLGDLVKDGKIDMRDIGAMCALYGTKEGDPDWNPNADLNGDKKVDMRDIGIVVNGYGRTCIY